MGTKMRFFVFAGLSSLYLLSPNLLFVLDIGYMSPSSSAVAKIHPSSYLAIIAVGLLFVSAPKGASEAGIKSNGVVMCVISTLSFVLFNLVNNAEAGGESSVLIVTYFSAGLFAYLLTYIDNRTMATISSLLSVFFILNSTLALFENFTSFRLLPFVLSEEVISWDMRPTAILGHPLTNATLTGAWILGLLMWSIKTSLKPMQLLVILFHLFALMSFGGRVALVSTLILSVIYLFLRGIIGVATRQRTKDVIIACVVLYASILCIPIILESGVADVIIDRFLDSKGSDETRYAAYAMLSHISGSEWFTGIPIGSRTMIQVMHGSVHGIELSWVALVMQFGLPIAACLLVSTWKLLRSVVGKGVEAHFLLGYFFITTFTSLSIASKSLLISQMILIMAVYRWRVLSAFRQPPDASRYSVDTALTRLTPANLH